MVTFTSSGPVDASLPSGSVDAAPLRDDASRAGGTGSSAAARSVDTSGTCDRSAGGGCVDPPCRSRPPRDEHDHRGETAAGDGCETGLRLLRRVGREAHRLAAALPRIVSVTWNSQGVLGYEPVTLIAHAQLAGAFTKRICWPRLDCEVTACPDMAVSLTTGLNVDVEVVPTGATKT